jgi:hypothetical protein
MFETNQYGFVAKKLSGIYRIFVKFQTNLLKNFMKFNLWAKNFEFY